VSEKRDKPPFTIDLEDHERLVEAGWGRSTTDELFRGEADSVLTAASGPPPVADKWEPPPVTDRWVPPQVDHSHGVPEARPQPRVAMDEDLVDRVVERLQQEAALHTPDIVQRLDELVRCVSRLTEGPTDLPGWLLVEAGDPRTYDVPDSSRIGVQARIYPRTYTRLKGVQKRLGLRTVAGAWEYTLRQGLAVIEAR